MPNTPIPSHAALVPHVLRARLHQREAPPAERIVKPGPGQESVWDFPRPPRVEAVAARVRVIGFGQSVADSTRALRVVETAGAPCYYLPPDDCALDLLVPTKTWTLCEWKGIAFEYNIAYDGLVARAAAWSYPEPLTDLDMGYERIAGWFAFYAGRVDACYIGDERVQPQRGGYYGGWITAALTGPIKGDPGSGDW